MYVYLTRNLINNKIYIGKSTKEPEKSRGYLGSGKIILKSIKKYGKENFVKSILSDKIADESQLNNIEKYYIWLFNSQNRNVGYNIADGGNGGNIYKTLPPEQQEEVRKKRSRPGNKNGMFCNGHKIKGEKNGRFGKSPQRCWEEAGLTDEEIASKMEGWSRKQSDSLKEAYKEGRRQKPDTKGSKNGNFHIYIVYDSNDNEIERFNGRPKNNEYPNGVINTSRNNGNWRPKGRNKWLTRDVINKYYGWYCRKIRFNKREE